MPTYDYHCAACDTDFEFFQSMRDDPLDHCPHCEQTGKVKRLISSGAGIIFKGTGFYETDYRKVASESKNNGADSGSEGSKSDGGKSEGGEKKADAKPAKESSKPSAPASD